MANEITEDGRWVLMEENYPHTIELIKSDAEELQQRYQATFPNLTYTLFWDEYYEFSELKT